MKKLLLFTLFFGLYFGISTNARAQSLKEPIISSQKTDDGALVAYPNPTRDILVIKSKNPNISIKSIVFYSILGGQVAQYNVNSSFAEVNIDKLKSGKYLMSYIMSNNIQKVIQIIKL